MRDPIRKLPDPDRLRMTIRIRDFYANGDQYERTRIIDVEWPGDYAGDGYDDGRAQWAEANLFRFTGIGDGDHDSVDSTHDVQIIACKALPELVGYTAEFG